MGTTKVAVRERMLKAVQADGCKTASKQGAAAWIMIPWPPPRLFLGAKDPRPCLNLFCSNESPNSSLLNWTQCNVSPNVDKGLSG